MRLKLIACKVMSREIGLLSAQCGNIIDITYLRQGFHNEPEKLRKILQREINRIDANDDIHSNDTQAAPFDAILLGYGLCSGGTVGVSSQKYSLVIPRAHDCITLFLGSKERYRALFDENSGGVYWYTPGWIENCPMPSQQTENEKRRRYAQDYGEENADYLIETERDWIKKYRCFAYVDFPGIQVSGCREYTKKAAGYYGLDFVEYRGGSGLLEAMLGGRWDDGRFLIVPPQRTAEQSYDEAVIRLAPG